MTGKRCKDTLAMAFTVFRHGDRAPTFFTANDPNRNHWADGMGSLTKEGRRQAFELGKLYRKRYDDFLGPHYVPSEIYVYSTDTDRCLMSAQCCLTAMYPPTGHDKWHPTLDWQPIPVHTRPTADDPQSSDLETVVQMKELPDRFTEERHKMWYQNYIQNQGIWNKFRKFFARDGRPGHLFEIAAALDTVHIEMKNDLPFQLPQDKDIFSSISAILEGFKLAVETHPHFIKQGSELLTIILNGMIGYIDGSQKTKMYMYSLHDMNIWSVMNQLNISVNQLTEYCGSITFELHKLPDDQYYVRLLHCLRLDSEPVDIPLVDSLGVCPLKSFEDMVAAAQLRAQSIKSKF